MTPSTSQLLSHGEFSNRPARPPDPPMHLPARSLWAQRLARTRTPSSGWRRLIPTSSTAPRAAGCRPAGGHLPCLGCEHSTPWPFGSFYLPPPVSPPDGFREVRASSQSRWAARSPAMNSSQRGPSPRPGENRHLGRPALWGRMHQPHPLAWEVNSPPPTPRGRDPCVEVRLGVGEVRSAAKQV